MTADRRDQSLIATWWRTVDRWTVIAIIVLCFIGALLSFAASPAITHRIAINNDAYHFVRRHLIGLPVALLLSFLISLMSPRDIRRFAVAGIAVALVALAVTLVLGAQIKGGRRWIELPGFSFQPSEFAKPFFAVFIAWMFAEWNNPQSRIPGAAIAIGVWLTLAALLLLEPDKGQTVVISAICVAEFCLAGLPLWLLPPLAGLAAAGAFGLYLISENTHRRINEYFAGVVDPAMAPFQNRKAYEAFANGGPLGRGLGDGTFKASIPDAHTDFVYAVAGEEFGTAGCMLILLLFMFIVLRGLGRLKQERNLYVLLAVTGLLVQFGLQAFINLASSVGLIPTKGMTLPYLSYGLSSLVALGIGMGMLLALTRRRFGAEELV